MMPGVGATGPDCLSLAIALHKSPSHFPELLRGHAPLPARVDVLLRLAGGGSLEQGMAAPPFTSAGDLKAAARFFIDQVMLARDADHYHVLGLESDAPIEQVKEHHRLLMRVFHPDRSPGSPEATDAIAARINLAYNALRLPADRAAYDAKRRQASKASIAMPAAHFRRAAPEEHRSFASRLPPVVARNLPQFVLGSFAMVATMAVGIVYLGSKPAGALGGGHEGVVSAGGDPRGMLVVRETVPAAHAGVKLDLQDVPVLPRDDSKVIGPSAVSKLAVSLMSEPPRAVEPMVPQNYAIPSQAAGADGREAIAPRQEEAKAPAPVQASAMTPIAPIAMAEIKAADIRIAPQPRSLSEDDLVKLVARLSDHYEKGDLDAFLGLFEDNARIERGGKEHIRKDYEDLFRTTEARQLVIWDMSWAPQGELYRGEGNYQARVLRKGEERARVFTGKIKLEVVQANSTPRIRGLFH
jgi:DnaJ-like protein